MAREFADPQGEAVHGGTEIFEGDMPGERRTTRRFARRAEIELTVLNATFGIPTTNARFFHRRIYERVGYPDRAIASPRIAIFYSAWRSRVLAPCCLIALCIITECIPIR